MSELEIRKAVKERYSKIATSSQVSCTTDSNCCGGSNLISLNEPLPTEALAVDAGCGSPLTLINPAKGDVVVDLGSRGRNRRVQGVFDGRREGKGNRG
jgi:hypothetical protein